MNEEKRYSVSQIFLALLKAGCYLLLFLGSQLLVSVGFAAVAVLAEALSGGGMDPALMEEQLLSQSNTIAVISAVLTLAVLLIFFLIRRKNPLREAGLVKTDLSLVGAAAVLAPACYLAVGLLLSLFPESMLEQYNEASSAVSDVGVIAFLYTVIGAPLVEEVIFRGLIQSRLERAMPRWLAGLLAALVFGLCHGQILWVLYAFLLGFLFSRMRFAARSVLPSLAAHVAFNLLGYLSVALENVLSPNAIPGAMFALAIAGLIVARKQIPLLFGFGKPKVS